jgi:hypothetical protein
MTAVGYSKARVEPCAATLPRNEDTLSRLPTFSCPLRSYSQRNCSNAWSGSVHARRQLPTRGLQLDKKRMKLSPTNVLNRVL